MFDAAKWSAVLFDLNDTLYSRVEAAHRTYPAMFRAHLYPTRDDRFIHAAVDFMMAQITPVSMVHEDAFQALIQAFPPDIPFDLTLCQEYYFLHMHKFATVPPGTLAVLQKLRALGIKTAIVTNVGLDRLEFQRNKIKALGLEPYFDAIVLSGECGVHKPHRRVFDHACGLLGVPNEACLFVGDNPDADITGAINAGMEAIWLDVWNYGDRFAGNPRVHRVQTITDYFDLSKIPPIREGFLIGY